MVMAGHGIIISQAYKELQEFAEKGQFPVVDDAAGHQLVSRQTTC